MYFVNVESGAGDIYCGYFYVNATLIDYRKGEKGKVDESRINLDDCYIYGESLDEDCGREGHTEISSVEGHLHEGPVSDAHPEYFRECLHHRVRHVIGKAP